MSLASWITGGLIEGVGKAATDVGRTFWGDESAREAQLSAEQLATLQQYAAEFAAAKKTKWDSFVDGLNRLVRPGLALGAQAAFVWAAWDPVTFAETMRALSLVPELMWYVWLTIFGFYFGGRIIETMPKTWKIEPRALDVAKEIAAGRSARRRADAAERGATAAERGATAAERGATAAERTAQAENPVPATPEPEAARAEMRISEAGLRLIREFEGFQPRPYVCPGGEITIGYGHVIRAGESYSDLTEPEAQGLLARDCAIAERAVNQRVTVPLTQAQFDALVSFTFNVGGAAFARSTLLAKLNAGDMAAAGGEFDRWTKADGKQLPGLARRRAAERQLFEGRE